jgi:hypothetical protein
MSEKLTLVPPEVSIQKPAAFDLNDFKSQTPDNIAGVVTLQTALPHHKISEARDFARLHPDEENYWSAELCFVSVPIKGQKRDTLHLIIERLAMQFLPSASIKRFRLARATKPHDAFFLCHVPSRINANTWNETNLQACELAKAHWVQATSRKAEGVEAYQINMARDPDAFPEPAWPKQSLDSLIAVSFAGRLIVADDDPALLRLIGARQSVS